MLSRTMSIRRSRADGSAALDSRPGKVLQAATWVRKERQLGAVCRLAEQVIRNLRLDGSAHGD
jgi:hypothetical protein